LPIRPWPGPELTWSGNQTTAGRLSLSGFLLDTNVISELVKAKPEPGVTRWIEATDENLLYLSVLTMGEIRRGIAALPQASRRARLEAWLEASLRIRFGGRILPIDEGIADRWGRITAEALARKYAALLSCVVPVGAGSCRQSESRRVEPIGLRPQFRAF